MTLPPVRHQRDTRRAGWLVWSFIKLNPYPISGLAFFGGAFIVAVMEGVGVPYLYGTDILMGLAGCSFILLLAAPARPWVRAGSVAVPVLASGLRMLSFLVADPTRWNGALTWAFLAFMFTWAAPRLMPPPLSNGARRRWLADGRGGTSAVE